MRVILIFMAAALYVSHAVSDEPKQAAVFGEAITVSKSISIEYAISHLDELKNTAILINGKVSKVCGKKGCWMVLKNSENSIRVTFKGYKFFVPKDIIGKSVQAQGMLHEELMNISEAKHFAKDAGQSDSQIKRIKQKVKEYRFIATAVKITS